MLNIRSFTVAMVAGTALALAGCSTTGSDFGDQVASVSKDWKKGEEKVERGEDMIRDGNRQVRKGNDQIAKGTSEQRKAERALADAQAQYEMFATTIGRADTPEAAETEAKRLRKLEKDVETAEADVKDARSKQKRGKNNIEDGQSKIKKGKRLVKEGEAEMKKIEAEYRRLAFNTP